MSQNQVIYQIVEYLSGLKSQNNVSSEKIDLITSTLQSEFGISQSPENFTNLSYYPAGLVEIVESGVKSLNLQTFSESLVEAESNPKFDAFVEVVEKKGYFQGTEKGSLEYLSRQAKLIKKFKEKALQSAGPTQAELESQAEDLKFKGNTAINAKDFESAAKFYSEALKLTPEGPNSHVYYSNRAAAYCHLNRYQDAVDDCHSSIALVPDYVKAFSRLGLSNFFLEKYEDAVEAYERAVELEPDNKSSQDSLRQARNKLKKATKSTSVAESAPAGGMPDMSALAGMMGGGGGGAGLAGMMNNPNMKQAMDQMGGSAGLASLMKDPQMMAMAQQMMKDPSMMQKAMSMLGGSGGGGGGMPDMSALAGMMGGAGGNSPAAPSSSSSKTGAKKPFTGFEE
jgi:small glutamine-rich tetratricopeptide repeat-containing protein alpha